MKLMQPSPKLAPDHCANTRSIHPEFRAKGPLRLPIRVTSSYVQHLICPQLAVVRNDAFRGSKLTSLLTGILHVILTCAKEQMLWITTWRVVAMMANQKPFRNLTHCKFPSQAMRQHGLS